MKLIKIFKDIFAPKKCYWCLDIGSFLCKSCLKSVKNYENVCHVCKQKTVNFDIHFYCENEFVYYKKMIVLFHYKDKIVKKLIKDAKFYHKKDIFEDLSILLWEKLFENILDNKSEILLIPTPMYFFKKIIRWYNQSEILVKNLSKHFSLDYDFNLIKKSKSTKAQSHLSKMQRLENLKNCYKLDKNLLKKYKNKTIVIVDDVVSTWTTINEISKLLKNAWIRNIYWLCLACD